MDGSGQCGWVWSVWMGVAIEERVLFVCMGVVCMDGCSLCGWVWSVCVFGLYGWVWSIWMSVAYVDGCGPVDRQKRVCFK